MLPSKKISSKELTLYLDRFFSSPEYRESMKKRIIQGDAPGLEVHLLNLVYGKPKETLQINNRGDGTFILQIGDQAQAHVVEDGSSRVIEGTAEEVRLALPEAHAEAEAAIEISAEPELEPEPARREAPR